MKGLGPYSIVKIRKITSTFALYELTRKLLRGSCSALSWVPSDKKKQIKPFFRWSLCAGTRSVRFVTILEKAHTVSRIPFAGSLKQTVETHYETSQTLYIFPNKGFAGAFARRVDPTLNVKSTRNPPKLWRKHTIGKSLKIGIAMPHC